MMVGESSSGLEQTHAILSQGLQFWDPEESQDRIPRQRGSHYKMV